MADKVMAKPSEPQAAVPLPAVETCVQAVLAGDLDSFGQLYDRYVRLVHAVCYDMTANHDQAHDLVHDTFLKAYRNLRQLRKQDKFGAWLLGIAHRVCKDWQRKRARDRHRFVGLGPEDHPSKNPADKDTFDQLRICVARLPQKERVALHLFYLEDKSAEQARELLGLSRSGFYRVLERARKRLKHMLNTSGR